MTGVLAAACLLAVPATAHAGTWSWSKQSMRYVNEQRLLPPSVTGKGPAAPITRKAFVRALARLDAMRAQRAGSSAQLPSSGPGAQLPDVPASSAYARAVRLGWLGAYKGRFSRGRKITGDEAARGIVGALGLRQSAATFAERLRSEVPGARTSYYLRAAQVYVRVLNMRYNMPAGQEQWEVGPGEPMRVAHLAYMLHTAATVDEWRLGSLTAYENFDLPSLGRNQRRVLQTGVRLLGHPYVWAGETEGYQAEGHGGFDCSGFVWRTVNDGGVPARQRHPLTERTSMDMSRVRGRLRVRSASQLRPGDLMFWGYKGRKSKPSENFHTGVYMGNGWFIHSSGGNGGPNIDRLDGWWGERFSWGRRVLRRP